MPVCVECGHSVVDIYKEFSKGSVRLTRCDHCQKIADKYVEFEVVLIVIDLILHRPQVYRHILFNRIAYQDGIDTSLWKLLPFYLFFDAYLKSSLMTPFSVPQTADFVANSSLQFQSLLPFDATSMLESAPVSPLSSEVRGLWLECWALLTSHLVSSNLAIFIRIAGLTFVEYIAFTAGILLCALAVQHLMRISHLKYNYIVMALAIASFPKLCSVPLLIFPEYTTHHWFSRIISLFVYTSQFTSLKVFFGGRSWIALILVLVGLVFKSGLLLVVQASGTNDLPLLFI